MMKTAKRITYLVLAALFFMLALTACSGKQTAEPQAVPGIYKEEKVPELILGAIGTDAPFDTISCQPVNYSWSWPKGNGEYGGVEACGMGPTDPAVMELRDPILLPGAISVKLVWPGFQAHSVTVVSWDTAVFDLPADADASQQDSFLRDTELTEADDFERTLVLEPNRVYDIYAYWQEVNGSSFGNAHYYAVTRNNAAETVVPNTMTAYRADGSSMILEDCGDGTWKSADGAAYYLGEDGVLRARGAEDLYVDPSPAPTRQDGERFEDVIILEGMEETVHYEHIRNDALGFEMDYDYENFIRHSEADREWFVSCWDSSDNPENYLEVRYSPLDAESAAAAVSQTLSNDYEISTDDSFPLGRAGSCIRILAEEVRGGGYMPEHLQTVYIIPAGDGCRVATAHCATVESEGFLRRFRYMMNTFSAVAAQMNDGENQQSASGTFTGVQGTEFIVPDGFIQLDESPNIGYQYTFWHPEYEIRIVVNEIAPGYIPEGAYETDYNIALKNPDVTYFNHGDNWFVQSGYNNNGEEIFYSKECTTDRGLKTIWISYPTAKREFGDPIAAAFENNCRF